MKQPRAKKPVAPADVHATAPIAAAPTVKKKRRTKRKAAEIIEVDEGNEDNQGADQVGARRAEAAQEHDIFSASKYHWLFLSLDHSAKIVPWGQVCGLGECHAIYDETEEGDADPVRGTDSMYEFAGINPRAEEGELFTRCFPCHCRVCRELSSVNVELRACPNLSQTGGWRKAACHRTRGVVQRASKMRDDVEQFAKSIKPATLYAAIGNPKSLERGGRPYWLFRSAAKSFKCSNKLRAFSHPRAPIIKRGTWVVKGQWYLSTALNPRDKRQSYKLLPEYHYIEVKSVVQEHDLCFQHEGRQGSAAESTFADSSHDRVMCHNFSSYK